MKNRQQPIVEAEQTFQQRCDQQWAQIQQQSALARAEHERRMMLAIDRANEAGEEMIRNANAAVEEARRLRAERQK